MSTPDRLHTFVQFVQAHLSGDEKGEAQIFLDKFFRAFGHEGAIEAGAVYEKRIQKGSKTGKTGFADLVSTSPPKSNAVNPSSVPGIPHNRYIPYWRTTP